MAVQGSDFAAPTTLRYVVNFPLFADAGAAAGTVPPLSRLNNVGTLRAVVQRKQGTYQVQRKQSGKCGPYSTTISYEVRVAFNVSLNYCT